MHAFHENPDTELTFIYLSSTYHKKSCMLLSSAEIFEALDKQCRSRLDCS